MSKVVTYWPCNEKCPPQHFDRHPTWRFDIKIAFANNERVWASSPLIPHCWNLPLISFIMEGAGHWSVGMTWGYLKATSTDLHHVHGKALCTAKLLQEMKGRWAKIDVTHICCFSLPGCHGFKALLLGNGAPARGAVLKVLDECWNGRTPCRTELVY